MDSWSSQYTKYIKTEKCTVSREAPLNLLNWIILVTVKEVHTVQVCMHWACYLNIFFSEYFVIVFCDICWHQCIFVIVFQMLNITWEMYCSGLMALDADSYSMSLILVWKWSFMAKRERNVLGSSSQVYFHSFILVSAGWCHGVKCRTKSSMMEGWYCNAGYTFSFAYFLNNLSFFSLLHCPSDLPFLMPTYICTATLPILVLCIIKHIIRFYISDFEKGRSGIWSSLIQSSLPCKGKGTGPSFSLKNELL